MFQNENIFVQVLYTSRKYDADHLVESWPTRFGLTLLLKLLVSQYTISVQSISGMNLLRRFYGLSH